MKRLLPLIVLFFLSVAHAANVQFTSTVATNCTLTVSQGGIMTIDPATPGIMSTNVAGGSPGVVGLNYLGTPTLTVTLPSTFTTAPTLTFTPAFSGQVTSSAAGQLTLQSGVATKTYSSGNTDTVTISLAVNSQSAAAFPTGSYIANVVVTCS